MFVIFPYYFFLLLPAFERAMAIAWRWLFPALISLLMFELITFLLEPFFKGIFLCLFYLYGLIPADRPYLPILTHSFAHYSHDSPLIAI